MENVSAQSLLRRSVPARAQVDWTDKTSTWFLPTVVGILYFLAARLGTALHLPPENIAIAWPAAGVALAAFVLTEPARWAWIALAVGVANVVANLVVGSPMISALGASVADILEGLGGAWLLRFICGPRVDMSEVKHVIGIAAVVAIVSPLCALLGAYTAPSSGGSFPESWRQWWIVDGLGIIILAPAVLSCASARWATLKPVFERRLFELVCLLTVAALVTFFAIRADMTARESVWSIRYLVFPIMVWSALRFGNPVASVSVVVVSAAAIASAIDTTNIFASRDDKDVVLALQVFLAVVDLSTLGLAALDMKRRSISGALEGLKNDLTNIIDSMPTMLVGLSRDCFVTQWSAKAETLTGIAADAAIGCPAAALLPDFWPWIKSHCGAGMMNSERIMLVRQGERRFYDLTIYPLVGGYLQGMVVMITDTTEQARVQEVILQTEKMISVGGLAAGMAHEINNPLGIITQAAQNIQRRVSPELPANQKTAESLGVPLPKLQEYFAKRDILVFIKDIREAAMRAANIVSNMLEFSRRSDSAKQEIDPVEVLERTLALAATDFDLKKHYDFRSIEIVRDYEPNLLRVPANAVEIEQVFLNLIKNAAQAMGPATAEKKPRLTLRTKREEKYVAISVEDNGPGMDETTRRRVFEPFFTTKEANVGTGLGLSVSFAIVTQNHKGILTVESLPGKGATFIVRLPFASEVTP